MTIETIFETPNYRYDYDTQYGVSWFVRLEDDSVTLMNTGTEAFEEMKSFQKLDPSNQRHREVFDSLAMEHSYSSRWSKEE
jgi:hypothetical protein